MSVKTRRSGAFLGDVGGKKVAIVAIGGLLAGLCNGLLGAGGGIVLYYAMRRRAGGDRTAFQMNVAAVLVFSLISSAVYLLHGNLDIRRTLPFLPVAVVGGFLGAFLLPRIRVEYLRLIFAAVTVFAGVRMLL